jgi:hypothetical protein
MDLDNYVLKRCENELKGVNYQGCKIVNIKSVHVANNYIASNDNSCPMIVVFSVKCEVIIHAPGKILGNVTISA